MTTVDINYFLENKKKYKNVKELKVTGKAPKNMESAFERLDDCKIIDVSKLDVSDTQNMSHLFYKDRSLKEIKGINNWNTKNLKEAPYCFGYCSRLKKININNWNTKSLKNIDNFFCGCYNLQSVDLSDWNTKKLKSIEGLCASCRNLTTVDLANWNTKNLRLQTDDDRYYTSCFHRCLSLEKVDLSGWNDFNDEMLKGLFDITDGSRDVGELNKYGLPKDLRTPKSYDLNISNIIDTLDEDFDLE